MERCVGSACGMGHGIALLLSPVARNNPAHMYIEFTRLQSVFPLHQNILRFWLCFSSHLSSQAPFNFWSSSVQPSWPYSGQNSLLQEKEVWADDPGMRYISVPVSCHVARQNVAREILPGPWMPSERMRWCQDVPLFVPHNWLFFALLTLWPSPPSFTAPQNYFVLLRFFYVDSFFRFC